MYKRQTVPYKPYDLAKQVEETIENGTRKELVSSNYLTLNKYDMTGYNKVKNDKPFQLVSIIEAVSYTHLDVYKRQDYAHWKEGLENIFEAVYKNKPFILNVYHDISKDQIEKVLFKLVHGLIESIVEERSIETNLNEQQKNFIAYFYKYGFVGIMPVSYTHLDVYKRQRWYNGRYLYS